MEEHGKLRRAALGLLLAVTISLAIWGIAAAIYVSLRGMPADNSAGWASWWRLPEIRYGLAAIVILGVAYEIRRVLLNCSDPGGEWGRAPSPIEDCAVPSPIDAGEDAPSAKVAAKMATTRPSDDVLPSR